MPLTDPGRLLRANALPEALATLEPGLEGEYAKARTFEDMLPEALVEEVALGGGVRARRLILDGAWWTETGPPMLARVAERRGSSRPKDPRTQVPGGTGWVALVPRVLSGYQVVATDPETGKTGRWVVTADIASRLAPFAFTFHRAFDPRPIGWKDALRFAWSYGRGDVALVVVLGLIAALVGLLMPVGTGHLINKVIPAGAPASVGIVIAGLAAAGLSLIGLQILRSLAQFRFDSAAGLAINAAMLDRVITAPASFFRKYASGDLALRVGAMNSVQHTISSTAIASVVAGLFLIANLGLMIWYSPKLALVAVIPAILAVAIPVFAGLARLKLARQIGAIHLKLSALSFEYFSGIAKLRAAAAEPRAFGNWIGQYTKLRGLNLRSARLSNAETLAMSVVQPGVAIAIYAIAWDIMASQSAAQRLRVGDFIAFQAALFALIGGLHLLVGSWMSALNVKPQWERAKPILDAVPERSAAHGKRHTPEGSLTLENVSFAYPDGPDVLAGISLSVRPGEFIAVVGTSGSGKSTLFRLLLGFEAPRTGTIRYDGQDVAELDLQRLRRGIGTVLQTGKLWAGDLYTNIVGASNADVEAAWHAARLAGIAPDIEKMPMGMYTLVGEGLSTISGGQRQRVLIARALVERPKVLLLDEATSALDAVAQQTVLEGLQGMNATRLVIAHRLDTVRQADRIIVLDGGTIVQEGSYVELAGKPGQFANMLARQGA